MANNYEFATVEPCIPLSLVGYFDKLLLEAYGFMWDATDSDGYYFYAKEGIMCDSRELDIDMDIRDFDVNEADDFEQDILASFEAGDQLPSYEAVFQHMIQKSRVANVENPVLTEIIVMGAYTCSKISLHPQFWVDG